MIKLIVVYLLVLGALYCEVQSVCVNKTALYSVNATVQASKHVRGHRISGNFYYLENLVSINVFQANVTDLCEGMIKNFPKLETLSLIDVNLSKIQPNAFQNVRRLKELSLAVNHLTEIVKGSFNGLPALQTLYLSGNEIERIEEGSFDESSNLKSVHLDRNKLTSVSGNLFAKCPKISLVDFRFNLIQWIGKEAFQDLKPNHAHPITIFVNRNQIRDVDPAAFDLPNPVILHLESNGLSNQDTLSNLLTRVKDNSRLFLRKNQFDCVPDDVIVNMRNTQKDLDVRENPLRCDCLDRIEHLLGDEIYGKGQFLYGSTFNCEFPSVVF